MPQTARIIGSALFASLATAGAIAMLRAPVVAQSRQVVCMSVAGTSGGFAATWMNQQTVAGKANFIEVSNAKLLCAW
jgi:hypothetical protein